MAKGYSSKMAKGKAPKSKVVKAAKGAKVNPFAKGVANKGNPFAKLKK